MKVKRQIEILNNIISILSDKKSGIICVCDALHILHSRHERKDKNYIDFNDWAFIRLLISDNKPTPENEFKEFINQYWIDDLFWWVNIRKAEETRQIRIDYVNALIDKISSKSK